jgi:exopolysaccharide production protein ExoQ
MTLIATAVFGLVILGLFWLNRDGEAQTSPALWLPVSWLFLAGSRPVSVWLQMAPPNSADQYLEGSPIDRNVYLALLIGGVIVLLGRVGRVGELFRENGPILLFVIYCAGSICWSDYPDVAFKRWIKSLGDLVMILIVLTDHHRSAAVKQVLARVGFLLLPLSILFIKYYPDLGRSYGRWEWKVYYTGVATDKNMLGMTCLIFGLASCWRFLQELAGSRRARILGVHAFVVTIALWLLIKADSMTSLACFLLASSLIGATTLFKLARRRAVIHFLVAFVVLVSASSLFLSFAGDFLKVLGRDPTLTGRTDLWAKLVEMDVHPVLGAGFESFWLGERLERLWDIYWWHPNESHNGYLEVYLNLGWAGVAALAVMMFAGYRNIFRLLSEEPEAGRLWLAYFTVGVAYNFTEAAVRSMHLVWIAFLFAMIALPLAPRRRSPLTLWKRVSATFTKSAEAV